VTVILLTGGGLLLRSLVALQRVFSSGSAEHVCDANREIASAPIHSLRALHECIGRWRLASSPTLARPMPDSEDTRWRHKTSEEQLTASSRITVTRSPRRRTRPCSCLPRPSTDGSSSGRLQRVVRVDRER